MWAMFRNDAFRKHPLRTSARVAKSLLRRRVERLRRVVVPYDDGRARMAVSLDTALGLTLYRYGLRDPDIEIVRRLLSQGDVFVDGGANVGLYSLVAATRVGSSGKVIAFEPARETRRALRENVSLSDFHNVEIRSAALADRAGTLNLTVFEGDAAALTSFSPGKHEGGHTEQVPVVTLDDALAGSKPRVIKLDLEGAEHAALVGAKRILSEREATFLIEVEADHLARQGASVAMVTDLLAANQYELFIAGWRRDGGLAVARGFAPGARVSPNVVAAPDVSVFERAGIPVVEPDMLR